MIGQKKATKPIYVMVNYKSVNNELMSNVVSNCIYHKNRSVNEDGGYEIKTYKQNTIRFI